MVMPSSTARQTQTLVRVTGAGVASVVGIYAQRPLSSGPPEGFARVCNQMRWPVSETWHKLAAGDWFEAENGSYLYKNAADGHWWLDEPSGEGVYIVPGGGESYPPAEGWRPLGAQSLRPLPRLEVLHLSSSRRRNPGSPTSPGA